MWPRSPADLAKRPRATKWKRGIEAFAAATKDAHATIAAAEDRFAQRSDDDGQAGRPGHEATARRVRRRAGHLESSGKRPRTGPRGPRQDGQAMAPKKKRGSSGAATLSGGLASRPRPSREEENGGSAALATDLSREADALHKAYGVLRAEVRQNVREGCSSPSRRRTTLWTRPRPSCPDWRTTARQATRRRSAPVSLEILLH